MLVLMLARLTDSLAVHSIHVSCASPSRVPCSLTSLPVIYVLPASAFRPSRPSRYHHNAVRALGGRQNWRTRLHWSSLGTFGRQKDPRPKACTGVRSPGFKRCHCGLRVFYNLSPSHRLADYGRRLQCDCGDGTVYDRRTSIREEVRNEDEHSPHRLTAFTDIV